MKFDAAYGDPAVWLWDIGVPRPDSPAGGVPLDCTSEAQATQPVRALVEVGMILEPSQLTIDRSLAGSREPDAKGGKLAAGYWQPGTDY